ncbi:hypothetical protein HJFPF1_12268 [Paramyrothecium foliicola]|nr:hypothetical protein HJFPF1_12268 [Paramyrothecium foliicola]
MTLNTEAVVQFSTFVTDAMTESFGSLPLTSCQVFSINTSDQRFNQSTLKATPYFRIHISIPVSKMASPKNQNTNMTSDAASDYSVASTSTASYLKPDTTKDTSRGMKAGFVSRLQNLQSKISPSSTKPARGSVPAVDPIKSWEARSFAAANRR